MESDSRTRQSAFATTHWTVVLSARSADEDQAHEALSSLCRMYWPPLYAFLRREGYPAADAEDLVQGFFARILARGQLAGVEREKGRFRSFLLKALRHHASNWRRDQRTQRRGGGVVHLDLDNDELLERCEGALRSEAASEVVYDRMWAQTIMAVAMKELRTEYVKSERGPTFRVISRWLAAEARPGDYATAAETLGTTEGALAAGVFRMRRRFREIVRAQVAHTVASPSEVDEEMRYVLRVLMGETRA